ncbi:hypothetical protein MRX96_011465 [Rhipicephalus microplus]
MCPDGKETAVTLYGCGVCAKAFALKEELDEHMQSHASRLFSCAVCGAIFVDKEHLEGHMRTHAPPEVFSYGGPGKPPLCSSSSCPTAEGPRGKKRPFVCPTCGKAFRRKEHRAHLLNHLTIHSGERPFSCATCQRTFRLREHAERHARTHAPPTEGPKESKALVRLHKGPIATTTATATMVDPSAATTHRCPLCPFATTSVNDFCKHVVLHAEGRSNCTVCDKKEVVEPLEAPKPAPGVVTVATVAPPSPQRCGVCGETFGDVSALQCHIRSCHTEPAGATQLLWSCSFCGLVFSQKAQLDTHMAGHMADPVAKAAAAAGPL